MKIVKFFTLGCKVNQYDTQSIRESLLKGRYKEINSNARVKADVNIINTCTVTHRADSGSLSLIRRARRENPSAKIVVTGCLAGLDKDKIRRVCADCLIVENKDKNKIAGLLGVCQGDNGVFQSGRMKGAPPGLKHGVTKGGILEAAKAHPCLEGQGSWPQKYNFSGRTRAFLKVQDGCDNFCSYCKVPLVRGRSKSRAFNKVITEAEQLVNNGFKEIVLTGICLGSYGKDLRPASKLVDLIGDIEKIKGLFRLRLSSIEAGDVTSGLIKKIAKSKIICPHLHIPLQSGDSGILKLMNRSYVPADYIKLIERLKKSVQNISITTDVLVGFPFETEENFKNTLRLIKKIMPLKVHIFPYSPRPGTYAGRNFTVQVLPQVIKERVRVLHNLADKCSFLYRSQFLGKKIIALIEAKCRDNPIYWEGHTGNYMKVRVKSKKNLKNQLICVKLKRIEGDFFFSDKID